MLSLVSLDVAVRDGLMGILLPAFEGIGGWDEKKRLGARAFEGPMWTLALSEGFL